jgi:hypothetical protein
MPAIQYNPALVWTSIPIKCTKKRKTEMTKLTRFFGTCLLVVSISVVALADGDGGETHGPPAPAPTPAVQYVTDSAETTDSNQTDQNAVPDLAAEADLLAAWLVSVLL